MKTILRVESSTRDHTINPLSSDFVWRLRAVKQGVKSIKLNRANVFNTGYIVNAFNNVLKFTTSGTQYSVTLAKGNYTSDTLATSLQSSLNSASSGTTFTVTVQDSQNKFDITGSSAFSLDLADSPLVARLLGFNAVNSSSATEHVSDNCFNVVNTPYYYLYVDEVRTMNEGRQCLCVIHNNVPSGSLLVWHPEECPQSLGPDGLTLDRLTLRLYDSDYNVVDLNGFDVLFEIEIAQ